MTTAGRTLIHVLGDGQAAVAARFSQRGVDRFAGLSGDWHGLPTIPDTAIRLACASLRGRPGRRPQHVMCLVTDAEIGAATHCSSYAREYSSPIPMICSR